MGNPNNLANTSLILARKWQVCSTAYPTAALHMRRQHCCCSNYTSTLQNHHKHLHSNAPASYSHSQVAPSAAIKYRPITKLLVANRGEIACRVMRTAKKMGIQTVAVFSDPDRKALHVEMADEAYHIGGAAPQESYLRGSAILDAVKQSGAHAVHPGYGFLSENAEFADACAENGIIFVGPPAQSIRDMGIKSTSKHIMEAAGVPVVGGYHGEEQSDARLLQEAEKIGFPVMIKAVRGGGGKGMRIAFTAGEFQAQLESARREALKSFNDDVMLVEKFVDRPRHVEVQVFGDQHGQYVYLFERDCSVQRRHQKIVEEAPAPGVSATVREELGTAAVQAARAVSYVGAGTVEFIMDKQQRFYFMEMNTRLQVEHPVTEMVTGTDLVEWQIRVAAGEPLPVLQSQLPLRGHSLEARVYAEEPGNSFLPGAGPVTRLTPPSMGGWGRLETGIREGDEVSVHYDPMIAKVVVWGEDRDTAIRRLELALAEYNIVGLHTNISFLLALLAHPQFREGDVHTDFIPQHREALLPSIQGQEREEHVCQAALSVLLLGQAGQGRDGSAFTASSQRLRLNQHRRSEVNLTCGEQVHAVSAVEDGSGWLLTVGGSPASRRVSGRLAVGEGGVLELVAEVDGVVTRTRIINHGRDVYLFYKEGARKFSLPSPKFLSKIGGGAGSAVGSGGAVAPMPGVVEKVLVEAGQTVQAGDPLVVIIAMKMEFVVKAGVSGRVEEVLHTVGETVAKDAPLVRIKGDDDDDGSSSADEVEE